MRQTTKRTEAPKRQRYQVGRMTQRAILQAAEEVLVEHGHAGFSLARVALEVGISRGNLNYYFPSRTALLETLIRQLLDKYRRRFAAIQRAAAPLDADPINDLIDWLLIDATEPGTNRLFRELWAMANHHRFVANALNRLQDEAVHDLIDVLEVTAGVAGAAARSELKAAAYLLATVTDGTATMFGARKRGDPQFERMREAAKLAVKELLKHARATSAA